MRLFYPSILAGICWLGAAFPAAAAMIIPDCAGDVEIARAHVVRVEKNGALILADGRAAMLEGIRLPLEGPMAGAALDQLRDLATAAPLTMTATRPKEDRYDRIRVQAFASGASQTVWLQVELLRRGMARVETPPDRDECTPDFYEAEQAARAAHLGLWASPAFAVRPPDSLKADIGSFQIVEGRVTNVERRDGHTVLDFGSDARHGFTAAIAPEVAKPFREADLPPQELVGRRVRVRGIVEDNDGRPQIVLTNPATIEVLGR